MIRDIRTMTKGAIVEVGGVAQHSTILTEEDAFAAWEQWIAAGNVVYGDEVEVLTRSSKTLEAYVNENRWVADCPECNSGLSTCPEFEHGFCGGCGTVFAIKHPPPSLIQQAEAVLAERPELARNWFPDRESILDLKAENAVRGVSFVRGA